MPDTVCFDYQCIKGRVIRLLSGLATPERILSHPLAY